MRLKGREVEVSSKRRTKTANAFRPEPMNPAGCPIHYSDLCFDGAMLIKSIGIVNTHKKLNPAHDYPQGLISPLILPYAGSCASCRGAGAYEIEARKFARAEATHLDNAHFLLCSRPPSCKTTAPTQSIGLQASWHSRSRHRLPKQNKLPGLD
jgi:hypothetical protein